MSEIRKHGIAYLSKKVDNPDLVAVSKKYTAEQSWTGRAAWWFDIPTEHIKNSIEQTYYLLCEKDNREFHVLQVPNQFFSDNIDKFEVRYNDKIRLHLEAEKKKCFVDQRGHGKVDFSSYLMEESFSS